MSKPIPVRAEDPGCPYKAGTNAHGTMPPAYKESSPRVHPANPTKNEWFSTRIKAMQKGRSPGIPVFPASPGSGYNDRPAVRRAQPHQRTGKRTAGKSPHSAGKSFLLKFY